MKKTRLFFFFCIAISIAAVSCQEGPIDNTDPKKDHPAGPRTLTVSIAATKTSLNGEQPEWSENDAIWVKGITDGKDSVYTVPQEAIGRSKFELTTWIEGDIVAVYPASAKADESPYFSVEHDQDGSFANANICVATAPETADELKFYNKTALFEIRVPEGTTKLTVSSLGKITTSDCQRGTEKVAINSDPSEKYDIVIYKDGESIPDTCFVSVLTSDHQDNNVILTDLNFDVDYGDKSAMGGFPPNKLRGDTDTDNSVESVCKKQHIKQNGHYTLGAQYFHEYVEISLVDGLTYSTFRWATTNIGASSETDDGEYFAWGETIGHKGNSNHTGFLDNYAFSWENCPYRVYYSQLNPNIFTKYAFKLSLNKDYKDKLQLYDDAAFANWGGAWRMPVSGEIEIIHGHVSFINKDGVDGISFGDDATTIFLPVAGNGGEGGASEDPQKDNKLNGYGEKGLYWSSSLDNDNDLKAKGISIAVKNSAASSEKISDFRSEGCTIRPFGGTQ